MILTLLLLPTLAGLLCLLPQAGTHRRTLLLSTAIIHTSLTGATWLGTPASALGGWLQLDPLGQLFLSITSALFLAAAVYSIGYLRQESPSARTDFEEGFLFANAPEATFTGCFLLLPRGHDPCHL